jgi:peptide/nickel transport system substrate-binding protein
MDKHAVQRDAGARARSFRRPTGRPAWLGRGLAVLVALVLLSACPGNDTTDAQPGDSGAPIEEEGPPVTGGSITVGVESETNTYLPSKFAGSQAGFNVALSIYDPLMTTDSQGKVVPYLAESLTPNNDFTRWTLKLRPGVKFHDGTPLNGAALKDNLDKYLKAEGANTAGTLRDVERMDIVDDLTVMYVLARPNSAMADLLQNPAGWPFSPTAAAQLGDKFGSQPVGTGPFRFVSWQRDGTFVAERNPDYWQKGQPYLDKITFRPIPDEETRATSLASGDIDATQSVRLSPFLSRVQSIEGVKVIMGLGNSGGGTMINVQAPPVDDVRVRQALATGVKQQAMIDVVGGDSAGATEFRTQFYAKKSPMYSEKVAQAWPTYDVEKAKALLREYVNDPKRSDAQPVGSPVRFTYGCTNTPSLQEQAQAFQAMWKDVGFEVELKPLEQSVHIQTAISGDYQVKCYRVGSELDPFFYLQNVFGDPKVFATNLTNYHNAEVQETLDTLRTTTDVEKRKATIEQFGLRLARDLPFIWTGSDLAFVAGREPVKGIATWVLPDKSRGDAAQAGITMWGQVWLDK